MKQRRVTQRDVAAEAGVHRATVSLAVRNHPSIPAATRERVMEAAKKLGYTPDPMMSALAMYRSTIKDHAFQGNLAWLAFKNSEIKWKGSGIFAQYHEGAKSRSREHGFVLEPFEVDPSETSPKRLASILKARNIRGVLLCPQAQAGTELELAWDDFSFVTFGYSLMKPELHTVSTTQYRAMTQTMQKIHEKGYRRIAFAFQKAHDARADHNYLAGYLAAQFQIGEPPIVYTNLWDNPEDFIQRLKQQKPEAIVIGSVITMELIQLTKLRVPEDIAVACPVLHRLDGEVAGVVEDAYHIGEVAVDHLTRLVLRGERGVPNKVQRIHIEGIWQDGATLPPAKSRQKKRVSKSRKT